MAPQTLSEKILSSKCGLEVKAGDLVVCRLDYALGTDASGPMAIDYFRRMGGTGVADAGRLGFALDHYAPPPTPRAAAHLEEVRAFAREHSIEVFEMGEGIGHQLVLERGRALPGQLVVGADSHAVTYGALGAFATGIGSSDLAAAMISGKAWFRVPPSLQIHLQGTLAAGVFAKDAALALTGRLGAAGARYMALEFSGPGTAGLEVEDRMVLANMAVEIGAKAGLFAADEKTRAYLAPRTDAPYTAETADPGATYARRIDLDLSRLEPQVARPHQPDNVTALANHQGTAVDMVYLGTCTGGRRGDFHQALTVLETGGGPAAGVQVVVTPASREVEDALRADGTLERFTEMGAVIQMPGCGSCCGTCGVAVRDNMTVVSTANRNFRGRMGNRNAAIYLASPAACAAAAVKGHLCDPREFLNGGTAP